MPDKTDRTIANPNAASERTPDAGGFRKEGFTPPDGDSAEAPATPKLSAAAKSDQGFSKSPVVDRNVEGVRQAGQTPRPTDKPIE